MAANPSSAAGLDLFRLALELAEHSESTAQPDVARYFDALLKNAKELVAANGAAEIADLARVLPPEAIQLASALARAQRLRQALGDVHALSDVPAHKAAQIRRELDLAIAS